MVVRGCAGGEKNRSCEDHVEVDRTILNYQLYSLDRPFTMRTLAINSLFLNSPLTSVTFPCSSSSVQRILSSLVGRIIRPKLLPNPVEPVDVSSGGGCGACNCANFRIFAELKIFHALFGGVVENLRWPCRSISLTERAVFCGAAIGVSNTGCETFVLERRCEVANALLPAPSLLLQPCVFILRSASPEYHLVSRFFPYRRRCWATWAHCANGRSNALVT
jgi:hypothetical protein